MFSIAWLRVAQLVHYLQQTFQSGSWMAISQKARRPRVDYPLLRIVRFSEVSLECGLLLGRHQPAGLNQQSQVVSSGPRLDRGKKAASDSPTVVRTMEFDPAPAGPFEYLVLECALTTGNLGPPGQESHVPLELHVASGSRCRSRLAAQSKPSSYLSPPNSWFSNRRIEESGFATAPRVRSRIGGRKHENEHSG